MKELTRITTDPQVVGGKPCIRGLRVTVGTIVGLVAAGRSREEILKLYPYLEEPDIAEALSYAAWRAEEIEVPSRGREGPRRHEPVPVVGDRTRILITDRFARSLMRRHPRARIWIAHTLPPPIMWQSATRASFTCRFPASPRSCNAVSQICASPAGPPGCPRAMSPPSVDTGTRPPSAKSPRSIAASASPAPQSPSSA